MSFTSRTWQTRGTSRLCRACVVTFTAPDGTAGPVFEFPIANFPPDVPANTLPHLAEQFNGWAQRQGMAERVTVGRVGEAEALVLSGQ